MENKKTMINAFNNSMDQNNKTLEIMEAQAVHAYKSGLTSEDLGEAMKYEILPIELMEKKDIYKKRFPGGVYDPAIIKAEIVVLDAREGGQQYLRGERFTYIRDFKIFKQYGWTSFVKFVEEDTPYSASSVYNWMNIYENYTYEEALNAGSKLSLIHSIQAKDENERAEIVRAISDEDMSYRDAKVYIAEKSELTDSMTIEDIKEDSFYAADDTLPDNEKDVDLSAADKSGDKFELAPVRMFASTAALKKSEIVLDEDQQAIIRKTKMKSAGILMFADPQERRAVIDLLNTDPQIINILKKKVPGKIEEYKASTSGPKDKIRSRARAIR